MKTLSAIFPGDILQKVMKSSAFAQALGQHVNLNSPCGNWGISYVGSNDYILASN